MIILEELKFSLKIDDDGEEEAAPQKEEGSADKQESTVTEGGNFQNQEKLSEYQKNINLNIYLKVKEQFQTDTCEKRRKHMEVPDYLLCRITDELMDEPVLLESGFTYEKQEIQKHF